MQNMIDVTELRLSLQAIADEEQVMAEFDSAMQQMAERNAGFSEEEIAADVEQAIAEIRNTPTK